MRSLSYRKTPQSNCIIMQKKPTALFPESEQVILQNESTVVESCWLNEWKYEYGSECSLFCPISFSSYFKEPLQHHRPTFSSLYSDAFCIFSMPFQHVKTAQSRKTALLKVQTRVAEHSSPPCSITSQEKH